MKSVNVGMVGLGNVGMGTLEILAENGGAIGQKLGFGITVRAVSSRSVKSKTLPAAFAGALKTANWREVVEHPEVEVVAELVGGTGVAREIVETAIACGKSVVTANKELMALAGAELWDQAIAAGVERGIAWSVG